VIIRRPETIPGKPVQMDGVKGVTMRMIVGRDDGAPNFSMRHFTVEPGGNTPHHSHNYEHEVFIVEGAGTVECDGEHKPIKAGDALFVPPNSVHQFVNTSKAPLKFLCLVPTQFDCGKDGMKVVPGS
jgi:quercetin dioxygenase-like cupin family protein